MNWVQKLIILNLILVITQFIILFFIAVDVQSQIPGKIMFIISNPKDLFKYFGPTLSKSTEPYIVSLSAGDENFTQAQNDFSVACSMAKINPSNCIINSYNPESFNGSEFLSLEIKSAIEHYQNEINPKLMITYDFIGMNNNRNSMIIKSMSPRLNVTKYPLSQISKMVQMHNNKIHQTHLNDFKFDNVSLLVLQTPPQVLQFIGFFSIFSTLRLLKKSNSISLILSPASKNMYNYQRALSVFEGEGTFLKKLIMVQRHTTYVNRLVLPALTIA